MRASNRLTEVAIRATKQRGLYPDGGGLYLQVSRNGSRSWVLRYRSGPRRHDLGLGPLAVVSLAEARRRAQRIRQQLLDGIDPLGQRRSDEAQARLDAAKAMTFDQCRDAFIAGHEAGWRNAKHRQQWRNTLETYATPVIGKLPVAAIDTGLVLRVLEPIWTTKPETAGRLRGRIESVLSWATTRGYRTGENPARWKGHLDQTLPAQGKLRRVEHHAALPYVEVPAFLAELRQQSGAAASALELTVLTACRTGDVLGARWSEIDFEGAVWTITAERMKAGREHRVPLCDAALAVLRRMREVRRSDFVFPSHRADRPLSNMSMAMLLRRMGRGEVTVHGFRSSFRDWAAERTTHDNIVVEMALAHTIGSKVEAAYRRGDLFEKRRRLMTDWDRHCNSLPSRSAEVVSLHAGRT
jgi:integrase